MNIYKIEVSTYDRQDEMARKFLGVSAATNEYDAIKKMHFHKSSLKTHGINSSGQDEWMYTAANAKDCLIFATKI